MLLLSKIAAVKLTALATFAVSTEPIDINTAGTHVLGGLLGGGPNKAEAIVAYRQRHGAFHAVEELIQVRGIGKRTIETNRTRLVVKACTC